MQVELGGGLRPHPASDLIIDLHHPKNAFPQDATRVPWQGRNMLPIKESSVDRVYSSHFLEHVPHGQPLIDVMNEAWRILRPGGLFEAIFPLVGYTNPYTGEPMSAQIGWQPWADPTHVSYWWLPEAFMYFAEGPFKPNADYGISVWGPLGGYLPPESFPEGGGVSGWTVRGGWEGHITLERPT